jgi:hypothetical protein
MQRCRNKPDNTRCSLECFATRSTMRCNKMDDHPLIRHIQQVRMFATPVPNPRGEDIATSLPSQSTRLMFAQLYEKSPPTTSQWRVRTLVNDLGFKLAAQSTSVKRTHTWKGFPQSAVSGLHIIRRLQEEMFHGTPIRHSRPLNVDQRANHTR